MIAKNALPEEITRENKATVEEADAAYRALTDARKTLVGGDVIARLEAAKKAPEVKYGDINDESKVDASDALLALQPSVELIPFLSVK